MATYSPPMPAPVRKRKSGEAPDIPGQRSRGRGQQVDGERDEEQLFAAQPIGQPAEQHGARDRPGDISAAGEPDVGIAEVERRALFQRPGDGAGQRHLQPIQNPGNAQRNDDKRMESAPGQPIEPRWNVGRDDPGGSRLPFMGGNLGRCHGRHNAAASADDPAPILCRSRLQPVARPEDPPHHRQAQRQERERHRQADADAARPRCRRSSSESR